jgi:hypothetical protein
MTGSHRPNSIPPATEDIDLEWGEEILPIVGADPHPSPYERITVAPPVPPDQLAAELMGGAPPTENPFRNPRMPAAPAVPAFRQAMATIPEVDPLQYDRPPPSGELSFGTDGRGAVGLDSLPPPPDPFPVEPPPVTARSSAPAADLELELPPRSEPGDPFERAGRAVSDLHLELQLGGEGDALDLVGRQSSPEIDTSGDGPLVDVRDRFAVGDFSGALVVAESILESDATNAEAKRYAESCRDVLKQMYVSRLGGTAGVPQIAVPPDQIRWLSLDHKSGFLLSLIDGMSRIEEILDVSGMPELDALRILFELLQQNVIRVG